ncbi:hypothetical protein C1645_735872 [Glomus cerebriforme]|uniref:Uncharacterized protein n=1 Tax=Glomus cerebriforme TaxID=658196 RepID=A0A397TDM5_9GLOM|nr:hypothetical protein C1645_735872 [Glomus cerebriforme]
MAEKENSVHHVLNTLARRGDPSSLRASASLALMLRDDSTEERIRRYHEKAEEKKALNTEGNSSEIQSNTQSLSMQHKSLKTESDESTFDSSSTNNFIKILKADVEIKNKDIDEKDLESSLGYVNDEKNSNINLAEIGNDSLELSQEVTTSQNIELDKHDLEIRLNDDVGTSTTNNKTVFDSGQIEINLSSDEEVEI